MRTHTPTTLIRLATAVALSLTALTLVLAGTPALAADDDASLADLDWMVGSWTGDFGAGTLEENWVAPIADSMSSLVRATNADGTTRFISLFIIENTSGSLKLRMQQFKPDFSTRYQLQEFKLISSKPNVVRFEATTEGIFKTLGYSRPEDGQIVISGETSTGQRFDIPLAAK